ncbi:MAG: DUF5110 domain-containing protein [Dysgonamonadaceae bacterium]|jgi:alpha-glucosidase (family GH31 glycosyl hydrolase)|nr:DUF5110 domain-containing protein [Dysgonamonadaceae bacterium]
MKNFIILLLFCVLFPAFTSRAESFVIGNSRFTFYSDNVVRMEAVREGAFLDEPTLFAYNRQIDYKGARLVDKGNNRYELSTPAMRVEYYNDGFPFGQTNLAVYFKMKGEEKERRWYIASTQRRNLKGALATLDDVSGAVPRDEGLISRDGWYLINDTNKDYLKDGWLCRRDKNHIQDFYLFVYGNDYKAALKSLAQVSGKTPMTRKYIHGAWYCRWWNYTDDDYRQIAAGYKEHDFPLDILVFDMGWHTQNATIGTGHAGNRGWTGYSWNRKLIPDPAALIQEFKDDNIYVALNEHPHDGLRPHEDAYPEFMKALSLPENAETPLFDAGDRRYMDAFLKYAHGESDSMGVAFWWLDWQQDYLYPIVRGTDTKHLAWLNHLFYEYSKQGNLRGAGFSRWAGWGSHRYPIQFSGDAAGNWDVLRFEIDLTTTSGNAGCFFWAHDVGGFYGGKDAELYVRWTQFAMLNSSLRIHSVYDEKLDRRPWLWGDEAEQAMRKVYHERAKLMPYIYSSVRQCHTDMLPLNRGMYIEYPDSDEAYKHPYQFLFGDLMLAAPVIRPQKSDSLNKEEPIWLPDGDEWYHYFTGKHYAGGQNVVMETSPLDEFPFFVKGGYPLPMQPYTQRMASAPLTTLTVRCYPAADADHSYTLYEDDGLTMDYEQGKYATTRLRYQSDGGKTTVTVYPAEGSYNGQVRKRAYRIELPAVAANTAVSVNGKRTKAVFDKSLNGIVVNVPAKDIRQAVRVTF